MKFKSNSIYLKEINISFTLVNKLIIKIREPIKVFVPYSLRRNKAAKLKSKCAYIRVDKKEKAEKS
jgi:hypothetical protein